MVGLVYIIPGLQNCSTIESILYVLPNTIWFDLFCHYCYNFLFYHMTYLYLMCSYLKMKIGSVDEEMKQSLKKRRRPILPIIKKFSDIIREINEYNTTYWSKYLFVFCMTFGTVDVGLLSVVIYGSNDTMMTIVWSIITSYLSAVFLVVILIAASVNSAINRMYVKCISLFILFSNEYKGKQNLRFKIRTMIKVINIYNNKKSN